jgi:muramoyltetrapeptide carboxypeptidase LdcA involved in peptidoglycan recycling
MSYKEWKEMVVTTYDVVSKNFNRRVYESVVEDPKTGERELIQLTLNDVLNKCEGTIFETQIRQAVMRCVYTEDSLEKEIRPVMDLYYS